MESLQYPSKMLQQVEVAMQQSFRVPEVKRDYEESSFAHRSNPGNFDPGVEVAVPGKVWRRRMPDVRSHSHGGSSTHSTSFGHSGGLNAQTPLCALGNALCGGKGGASDLGLLDAHDFRT